MRHRVRSGTGNGADITIEVLNRMNSGVGTGGSDTALKEAAHTQNEQN